MQKHLSYLFYFFFTCIFIFHIVIFLWRIIFLNDFLHYLVLFQLAYRRRRIFETCCQCCVIVVTFLLKPENVISTYWTQLLFKEVPISFWLPASFLSSWSNNRHKYLAFVFKYSSALCLAFQIVLEDQSLFQGWSAPMETQTLQIFWTVLLWSSNHFFAPSFGLFLSLFFPPEPRKNTCQYLYCR